MSSLLGGMLGAGAGMYLYDSFFRGSTPTFNPDPASPLNADPITALSFTDTTATPGQTWYYKAAAFDAFGNRSAFSAMNRRPPPTAPFTADNVTAG